MKTHSSLTAKSFNLTLSHEWPVDLNSTNSTNSTNTHPHTKTSLTLPTDQHQHLT